MKRTLVISLMLLAVMALMESLWRRVGQRPAEPLAASAAPQVPSRAPSPGWPNSAAPSSALAKSPEPIPAPPLPPDHPARAEADSVARNLRHFGQRFGGNPVGTNAEIVHYLNGGNPHGVRYLPQGELRLNEAGELLDSWGTPYFFHQLSARDTEIRSAGPDHTLWTGDDVVAK